MSQQTIWIETKAIGIRNKSKGRSALFNRGGVEDTRLEAKAKDTKKIRGQGQGLPFREQTISRPRTRMFEAEGQGPRTRMFEAEGQGPRTQAQVLSKKKVFTKIFQAISTKKGFPKNFSNAPQNFNNSKNSAVLEPRTSQFSRTWGLEAKDLTFKAKDFKMCPWGRPRGLHLCSSIRAAKAAISQISNCNFLLTQPLKFSCKKHICLL